MCNIFIDRISRIIKFRVINPYFLLASKGFYHGFYYFIRYSQMKACILKFFNFTVLIFKGPPKVVTIEPDDGFNSRKNVQKGNYFTRYFHKTYDRAICEVKLAFFKRSILLIGNHHG